MKASGEKDQGGQVLPIAVTLLVILCLLVPLMVRYVLHESSWTGMETQRTHAFHSSEAGIEKGYLELSLSTQTWVKLMRGGASSPIADFHFDTEFTDVAGGSYKISITSGPLSQQATVVSVGRDNLRKEIRAVKAVYSNIPMGGNAIYASAGADLGGKVDVEWGSIISPQGITPLYNSDNSKTWPQLWSAGSIVGLDTDPNPPNCDGPDCCWWHSFQANLPPTPIIDLNYYSSQAKAAKASTYGCPAGALAADCNSGVADDCCYYQTDPGLSGASITGGATVYINNNVNVASSHGGSYIEGSLIVIGNLTTSNGNFGGGPKNYQMSMPSNAWQQYCEPSNAWPHYRSTFDTNAPLTFPGLNATSYQSPSTCSPASNCQTSQLFSNGLLYVTGYMATGGGGGGTDFYGVMYVLQTSSMTNNSNNSAFYYNQNAAAGLQLTQVILNRVSWQEMVFSSFP